MITTFSGKRVSGILGILPETEYDYDEETKNIATRQTKRLKSIMGFGKRRAAKATSTTGDFCEYGLKYLFEHKWIEKNQIGAIVVVGLTPDYLMPHNSNILHGQFDLPNDVICIDIPQGCCGYMMGLFQAFMLLEHLGDKKVLVFTGDVLNRKDPNVQIDGAQFGGDAASVSIVENDPSAEDIQFSMYTSGKDREALIIHAGGYRMPHSEETKIPRDIGDGTMKPYDAIWMDGSKVFNFVQIEVPPMIEELLDYAKCSVDDVDWFMFHQPNKFMLQKLADKMKVSHDKMPMNVVERFGNSSGSTIPIDITTNISDQLMKEEYLCCLAGFGSGLTWTSALIKIGKLDFCEAVISNL